MECMICGVSRLLVSSWIDGWVVCGGCDRYDTFDLPDCWRVDEKTGRITFEYRMSREPRPDEVFGRGNRNRQAEASKGSFDAHGGRQPRPDRGKNKRRAG